MRDKSFQTIAASIALIFMLVLAPLTNVSADSPKVLTSKLSKQSLSITAGKRKTLSAKGAKKKVQWKSSNNKVVQVKKVSGKYKKNATLLARKAGSAVITAKINGTKYTCKVTVKKNKKTSTNPATADETVTAEQKPATTEQTVTTEQKPAATEQTVTTEQKTAATEQTTATAQQASVTEQAVTAGQQTAATEQSVTEKQQMADKVYYTIEHVAASTDSIYVDGLWHNELANEIYYRYNFSMDRWDGSRWQELDTNPAMSFGQRTVSVLPDQTHFQYYWLKDSVVQITPGTYRLKVSASMEAAPDDSKQCLMLYSFEKSIEFELTEVEPDSAGNLTTRENSFQDIQIPIESIPNDEELDPSSQAIWTNRIITTYAELQRYMDVVQKLDGGQGIDSFVTALQSYDEAFFENDSLCIVHRIAAAGEFTFWKAQMDSTTFNTHSVKLLLVGNASTDDLVYHVSMVGISKADIGPWSNLFSVLLDKDKALPGTVH